MAYLHLIYDPKEKISNNPELEKQIGLRSARLFVSDDNSNEEIEEIGKQLVTLLMEQVRIGGE